MASRSGNSLTQVAIDKVQPGAARREVPDGKVPGLYLVVQPASADGRRRLSWAVRYRAAGVPRKFTVGPYPEISLADARTRALTLRAEAALGKDPASAKKVERQVAVAAARAEKDLFEKVAASFVERYAKAHTRESSWQITERLLAKEVTPLWKGRRVQEIAKRDVLDLMDGLVDRGAPIQANRVLAVVRKLFNWCVERDILTASPCAGLKAPTAERSRDRVLTDDELRLIWKAVEGEGWPFGPFVQLLMLTGQRREEVAGMRWAELDLGAKLWTIPKARAKNDVAHQVPLSEAALAVLGTLPKVAGKAGLVFTTTGETSISGYSKPKERIEAAVLASMREADPKVEAPARWTLHDLRRTMASGMARLGVNLPVIEKVLNHVSGSFAGIVGVYQRHSYADEKRAALELWGRHVEALVSGKPAGNVVEMKRAEVA